MILNAFKDQAPKLPDYQAHYRIIYFEPIVDSGERFTIGIMAKAESGEIHVIQTIDAQVIKCMYGDSALQISNLISLTLESAREALDANLPINEITPSLGGTSLGPTQTSYSNQGMQGILFQAMTSYASLSKGKIIDEGFALMTDEEAQQDEGNKNLMRNVREVLTAMNHADNIQWHKHIKVDNTEISVDVLCPHYNANLSNFNIKHVKTAYNNAKAKLFDLQVLRDMRKNELLASQAEFELLISLRPTSEARYTDHVASLQELADKQDLRVVKYDTPKQIAERIILKNVA